MTYSALSHRPQILHGANTTMAASRSAGIMSRGAGSLRRTRPTAFRQMGTPTTNGSTNTLGCRLATKVLHGTGGRCLVMSLLPAPRAGLNSKAIYCQDSQQGFPQHYVVRAGSPAALHQLGFRG
jgi:hypothetical protein